MTLSLVTWLSAILLAVGGINWGLVGLFEFDLVAWLFGEEFGTTNAITRVVYVLVGLSAIVTIAGLYLATKDSSSVVPRRADIANR
jgi:uncharacterized membrane protein YuzA (DUF378 family)